MSLFLCATRFDLLLPLSERLGLKLLHVDSAQLRLVKEHRLGQSLVPILRSFKVAVIVHAVEQVTHLLDVSCELDLRDAHVDNRFELLRVYVARGEECQDQSHHRALAEELLVTWVEFPVCIEQRNSAIWALDCTRSCRMFRCELGGALEHVPCRDSFFRLGCSICEHRIDHGRLAWHRLECVRSLLVTREQSVRDQSPHYHENLHFKL